MPYDLEFYVDGGYRPNHNFGPIGAAAACLMAPDGVGYASRTRNLPRRDPQPTSQRAELTAIILELEWAVEECERPDSYPMNIRIYSDSSYAVRSLNTWRYNWAQSGWQRPNGAPVANQDLFNDIWSLERQVGQFRTIDYRWVPREANSNANWECNQALNEQQ
ncbi:ribonuclease H-like domain-containing protein [Xylariaceae sp. FL1651]|nr:ribonuclease H-like domain-containing protein [Xylariaceae sp. FL1651]